MPRPIRPTAMRIARPSRDLAASTAFYVEVVGLEHLGGFEDHEGYSGAFIGVPGNDWHLEFTTRQGVEEAMTPTDEDLLVLYLPKPEIDAMVGRLTAADAPALEHANPYWAAAGASVHRDPDGYLLVLHPG